MFERLNEAPNFLNDLTKYTVLDGILPDVLFCVFRFS